MTESSVWRMVCAPGGWVRVFRPADKAAVYMRLRGNGEGPAQRLNVHTVIADSDAPISTHMWRNVPFQAVEDWANKLADLQLGPESLNAPAEDEPLDLGKLEGLFGAPEEIASLDGQNPVVSSNLIFLGSDVEPDPGEEPPPLERPEGRITDEFLTALSRTYRWLVSSGNSAPATEISKQTGAPVATVRRWIVNARQRGMLPPGRPGRAG